MFFFYRNVKHKNNKLDKCKEFILMTYNVSTMLVLVAEYQEIYVVYFVICLIFVGLFNKIQLKNFVLCQLVFWLFESLRKSVVNVVNIKYTFYSTTIL